MPPCQMLVLIAYALITHGDSLSAQQYNRFNGATSGLMSSLTTQHKRSIASSTGSHKDQVQLELDAWQPLTHHNNWFILQATAASSSTSSSSSSGGGSMQRQRQRQRQQQRQKQQQQQKQKQKQRLPGNYYAHNHRYNQSHKVAEESIEVGGGNYKQVRVSGSDEADVAASPTYVLAVSKAMRRGEVRRQLPVPQQRVKDANRAWLLAEANSDSNSDIDTDSDEAYTRNEPEAATAAQTVQVDDDAVSESDAVLVDTTAAAGVDGNVNGKGNGNGNGNGKGNVIVDLTDNNGPGATFDNVDSYLAPFERALVKVRNFCDIVQSIISDDDDAEDENETETETGNENENGEVEQHEQLPVSQIEEGNSKAGANKMSTVITTTSKEVQGHQHLSRRPVSVAVAVARAHDIASGRKLKKLKKKFKKLLVPLLIAYKLKFLTLIPVLIGGLTLLVGTTGLAGFFFALFTAVMSLKSSAGGKSIVVKKI